MNLGSSVLVSLHRKVALSTANAKSATRIKALAGTALGAGCYG